MFSLKHASVQSRVCSHGRQNTHVVTMCAFPTKEKKIVTGCRCYDSVVIPLRSVLKRTIVAPVHTVPNLCSFWGISSVSGYVYLSFPRLTFIPHQQKPIKLWADTKIASTAVLILGVILMCSYYLTLGICDVPSFEL